MSGYSVPLFDVNFGEEEAAAVSDVIRSGWISMGPKVAEFEARFASELNSKHAVALNSCTAALHLAMATFVGEGDEVILPSMTFVATANAVRYAGARPIFADIVSSENLSIDPVDVERKITTRTKVILPMHYAGFSCDMGALQQLAAEHNLNIVEDAAHAPHSTYDGKRCGTLGDIGCFSFFSNKNITCAEGGMLVTDNDTYAARARLMRSHGMTSVSYDRARGHTTSYDVVELGFNYRLDDIRAALALVQLQKLGADVDKRAKLRVLYETRLQEVDAIVVPYRGASNKSSNYIFPIVINAGGPDRRDRIRASMANRGVQTSIHYPAVHRFSIYKEGAASLPVTEHVADNEITLPFFAGMSTEQVHEVCDALERALDE
jgi:dTDP-4-amino-4,6-dideoxygalactose transaminase